MSSLELILKTEEIPQSRVYAVPITVCPLCQGLHTSVPTNNANMCEKVHLTVLTFMCFQD